MLSFGASRLNTFSQGSILVSGASLLTSSRCFQNKRRYTRAGLTESSYQMEQITEADACEIIKAITPPLDKERHKGQAGKIAVIGGCREYTGAPYFAAISALKIGADLSHIFCTEDAATVIKSYSPELIVHPVLQESHKIKYDEKNSVKRKVLEDVSKWIERFDGLVVGPGLGRDEFLLDCVADVIQLARLHKIPIVLDGDALLLITNSPDLVTGYPLAILTPNINEYKRLYQKMMDTEMTNEFGAGKCLKRLAERMGGVTILRKGKEDIISDGNTVHVVNLFGSPRRCGGQGDILSGSVAVFSSWAIRQAENDVQKRAFKLAENAILLGSISGSVLMRKAASIAFQQCKRSTVTADIIGELGKCMETISPAQ